MQSKRYHRLTRANTPASAPLRRFLPFSPWRAPARLRIKSQKSLGNPSLAGGKQFCRAEMCPDKERPAGNTCCISKVLDAVWAHFCPSKPCLPLSIDGTILYYIIYYFFPARALASALMRSSRRRSWFSCSSWRERRLGWLRSRRRSNRSWPLRSSCSCLRCSAKNSS